jgi:hypothetical protein
MRGYQRPEGSGKKRAKFMEAAGMTGAGSIWFRLRLPIVYRESAASPHGD